MWGGMRGKMQTSGGNEANHGPLFLAVDRVNMVSAGFRVWRAGKREENQGEEGSRHEKGKAGKTRGGERRGREERVEVKVGTARQQNEGRRELQCRSSRKN